MEMIPINPDQGVPRSLETLHLEVSTATPKGFAPAGGGDPFTNFQVVSDALSVSLAAKLGLSAIFNGSVSANDKGFCFDAMTYTDQYTETQVGGGIAGTRYGVGLRVLLRVRDLSVDASLNMGMVGAAVALGRAQATYEIKGLGLGPGILPLILGDLPVLGDFTYETYLKLNSTVVKKVADYIKANKDTLTAVPVSVAVVRPLDYSGQARVTYYAMRQIAKGRPLGRALDAAPPALDRETIRSVYVVHTGSEDLTAGPGDEARRAADDWLRL